jgi:hypothetical protein
MTHSSPPHSESSPITSNLITQAAHDIIDSQSNRLMNALTKYYSVMYSNPQINLNTIQLVHDNNSSIVDILLTDNDSANRLRDCFNSFGSHFKRKNYFTELGTFIPPIELVVGSRHDFKKIKGKRIYTNVKCVTQHIPLRKVLEKFLSMEGVLKCLIDNMEKKMSTDSQGGISHFLQGSSWQSRKRFHEGKVVIPIFLHFDDFEPLNPLGAHSSIQKLGAVYASLPGLPIEFVSKLQNIFLVLIFHSSDRVKFGNAVIFHHLIEELNFLQRVGIKFDLQDYRGWIFFDLGCILGDNLGLHGILGFNESFSGNYPCRMCRIDRKNMMKSFRHNISLNRNMHNYFEDLLLNNSSLTGIKEKCVWLSVDNFDIFNQSGVDIMHDLHEGVIKYIISNILVHLIDAKRFFSIELLNNKLQTYDFGIDRPDTPPTLSMENLRKCNLRLSASETQTLVLHLSNMIGDLIPLFDDVWDLYLTLRILLDMVLAPLVVPVRMSYFKLIIAELCEKYSLLFKTHLKPKFHHLLHYADAMMRFGPLSALSSMRFEAKHRPNKLVVKSTCNRTNLTSTVANRHQWTLNNIIFCGKLDNNFSVGPSASLSGENFLAKFGYTNCSRVSWATLSAYTYKSKAVVVYDIDEEHPRFLYVTSVFLSNSSNIILHGMIIEPNYFDTHLFSYQVEIPTISAATFAAIDVKNLMQPCPCHLFTLGYGVGAETYVMLRKPV